MQIINYYTLREYLSDVQVKLLLGMVLGIDTPKSLFDKQLQIVGLTHLLVLSGSNISFLVRMFQNIVPTRNMRKISYSTLIFLGCIPIIFGSEPSTIRAVIMAGIPIIAILYNRANQQMHLIILSGIIMLIYNPSYLSNISFQLSYAAVIGITIFDQKEQQIEKEISWIKKYIQNTLRTTLAAQSLTTPIIFYHFGTISIISTLANLLVSWTVPIIMMIGMPYILIVKIVPQSGTLLSIPLVIVMKYFESVTTYLSTIPHSQISF
ncbi:MAG: ComEC/Rec2 family competence protein [Candidatus Roizmanbacteria bacterium]